MTAEEDEYGVVTVRDARGNVVMIASRKDWDATRAALGAPKLELTKVLNGPGVLFGISRRLRPGC